MTPNNVAVPHVPPPDVSAAESPSAATSSSTVRRAFTNSWQALKSRQNVPSLNVRNGTAERSVHAFDRQNTYSSSKHGADVSIRSQASRGSGAKELTRRRSLYDVDGMPEVMAPNPLLPVPRQNTPSSNHGSRHRATPDTPTSGGGGGGGAGDHSSHRPWRTPSLLGASSSSAHSRAPAPPGLRPLPPLCPEGSQRPHPLPRDPAEPLLPRGPCPLYGTQDAASMRQIAPSGAKSPAAVPAAHTPISVGGGGSGGDDGVVHAWDDARNPMSPFYDASLDHRLEASKRPAAGPDGAASVRRLELEDKLAVPYENQPGRRPWPEGAVAPVGPIDEGDDGIAVVGGNGGGNSGGGGGDSNREKKPSNSHFVILEMKGPGDPSTVAAAAAYAMATGACVSPTAPDLAAAALGVPLGLHGAMASYFSKWHGVGDTLMPADTAIDIFWTWLGAFIAILVVAVLHQFLTPRVSLPLMVASFGASAVLLFGVPVSKLAQPRNFLGGQVVSALVGVLVRLAFKSAPQLLWLSAALGMSLALVAMQLTRTVHPPGGASALIAASTVNIGAWEGFKFVLTVFFGSMAMLLVALVINNMSTRRRYPTYWLGK